MKTNIYYIYMCCILLSKTTAARNGVALSYHSVRGLYFMAVVFAATIYNQNTGIRLLDRHVCCHSLLWTRVIFVAKAVFHGDYSVA